MQNETKTLHLNANETERMNFRVWLQKQFTDRCKRNPRYSLRAFAKSLSLDASTLSQILSGKRVVSKKNMQNFCEKLSATPKDLKSFGLLKSEVTDEAYFQINLDTFSAVSDMTGWRIWLWTFEVFVNFSNSFFQGWGLEM